MPGSVPGIHVFPFAKAWMAGTSPAMTTISSQKTKHRRDVLSGV
jgi:hypothetical protein